MSTPTPTPPLRARPETRQRVGLGLALLGALVQTLGLRPDWFGLAYAEPVGLVQLLVFILGLGLVVFGGYLHLTARWNGVTPLPFLADVGLRLAVTGYMLTTIAALADILGFGSHPNPNEAYFGPWQAAGIVVGEILMLIGFLMAWPRGAHLAARPSDAPQTAESAL